MTKADAQITQAIKKDTEEAYELKLAKEDPLYQWLIDFNADVAQKVADYKKRELARLEKNKQASSSAEIRAEKLKTAEASLVQVYALLKEKGLNSAIVAFDEMLADDGICAADFQSQAAFFHRVVNETLTLEKEFSVSRQAGLNEKELPKTETRVALIPDAQLTDRLKFLKFFASHIDMNTVMVVGDKKSLIQLAQAQRTSGNLTLRSLFRAKAPTK